MELATVRRTNESYLAGAFAELDEALREELRRDLICTDCGADAYYVRPSRNGRPACFGARPHNESCDLASQTTESSTVDALTTEEERAAKKHGFTLRGADASAIGHTALDAPPVDSDRPGRSYTERDGAARGSYPGLKLNRLLRLLITVSSFGEERAALHLANGTRTTVPDYCAHMSRVDLEYRDRERVYWGTIRYAKAVDDGAWLNTGSKTEPSIHISNEMLGRLLDHWQLDSVEDLAGAAFALWGKIRRGRKAPDKLFLFVESLTTFVIIPEERI
ncbi:hypothetical protein [Microbacterium sp. NPDC091662]|uniref:hypothetical protein n=1 Tax=Microbacterium sp. NPDC091662 TaxID=3364211 RepID=UPI0038262636